jgi:hypothetical protein
MSALAAELWDDVVTRVRRELGRAVVRAVALPGGANNRLYELVAADGGRLLLKAYFPDERDRLGREFGTLAFLCGRGFAELPRALVRGDKQRYGVYSFEEGAVRRGAELSVAEAVAIARFWAELHRLGPDDVEVDLPRAISGCFSVRDNLEVIRTRLRDFLASPSLRSYPELIAFVAETPVAAEIESLIATALSGLPRREIDAVLPRSAWRLTNGDSGPHNVLLRPDSRICVLDWEYAGWEDPVRMAVEFVSHIGAVGMRPEVRRAFLGTYAAAAGLTDRDLRRLRQTELLYAINWAAVHLTGMTETKLASRRFALADFDLSGYLRAGIASYRARVAEARALMAG